MNTPKTLLQAIRYFSDPQICEAYMREIRWAGNPPVCPHCGGMRIGEVKTRNLIRCKDCRKQFSSKVGTIFEDSPLGLDKWFIAVWAIANCKNGISSHELGRAIGVTQRTAWFMLMRIRKAMEIDGGGKFNRPVEIDTTYIGGRADNMHERKRIKAIQGRGVVSKIPVHGILQRGETSRVNAKVIEQEDSETTLARIQQTVNKDVPVYTDEARIYDSLINSHAEHRAIDHSIEYVRGTVHINGIENFWALLKRAIRGTYVSVAPFHLFRYVAEQVFRFNYRKWTDSERFSLVLACIFNRRLTYRLLAGIDDAGFMGKQ